MSEAFDRLARRLADGSSRRDILKALGGFLAGSLLLGLGGRAGGGDGDGDADDVCPSYCSSCRRARCGAYEKCLRACIHTLRRDPKAKLCGSCTASTPFTACRGGATCCSGSCVNLDSASTCGTTCTNAVNCGTGGVGSVCCSGVCCGAYPGHKRGICCTPDNYLQVCPKGVVGCYANCCVGT